MTHSIDTSDAWSGGLYGLAMEFSGNSNDRALRVLRCLWEDRRLQGGYLEHSNGNDETPAFRALRERYRGSAILPNGKVVPCGSAFTRFDGISDWAEFFIPLGSLGRVYQIGAFPFAEWNPGLAWQQEVDSWLVSIATRVFDRTPFELGVVGFDPDITRMSASKIQADGIPSERFEGLLLPADSGLRWYPQTAPLFKGPFTKG